MFFRRKPCISVTYPRRCSSSSVTQVDHYEERKRPYTVVHDDLSGRNRQTYDRLRSVNHPFGMGRITVVIRRVVNGEKRTLFTLKSMP